ncbi:hypothetical protein Sjap_013795 [Stephania japonica]|uniref:Uncharacterized protein n=1 Tax=Stephania japonica TaxID=461633 RepID=A0AAP0NYY3_9MAGN
MKAVLLVARCEAGARAERASPISSSFDESPLSSTTYEGGGGRGFHRNHGNLDGRYHHCPDVLHSNLVH